MCHWQAFTHHVCGHYVSEPEFVRCPDGQPADEKPDGCGDVSTTYDYPNCIVDFSCRNQDCIDLNCMYTEKGPVWLCCADGLQTRNREVMECWDCGHAVCWYCSRG
jgi:hypothetical protein